MLLIRQNLVNFFGIQIFNHLANPNQTLNLKQKFENDVIFGCVKERKKSPITIFSSNAYSKIWKED
jgi:hypothetical protein